MSAPPPIPVICDKCRAEGLAGADPFTEIRDLLAFDPVPRRAHVNNWTAEHQRAFIAALAMTGSPRQAARALGRHAFGAEQLRTAKGGRSFAEAWDAALELYRERELFRIEDNLAGLARQQSERDEGGLARSHLRPLPPHSPSPARGSGRDPLGGAEWEGEGTSGEHDHAGLLDRLMRKYFIKLDCERRSRLAGDVVAADFYVRQLTWIEVALDLGSAGGLFAAFHALRVEAPDGSWSCGPIAIAETAASRYLDTARRLYWSQAGEPDRPPPAPEETFESHAMVAPDGRALDVRVQSASIRGGPDVDIEAIRRKREEDHKTWAEEQIAWEARAIAEHKAESLGGA